MWKSKAKEPIWAFIAWAYLLIGIAYTVCIILERTGAESTAIGNGVSTVINTLLGTLSPMYAAYIVMKRSQSITGPEQFIKLIFETKNKGKTLVVAGIFCIAVFCIAALVGIRTDMPVYWFIPAVPLMVLGCCPFPEDLTAGAVPPASLSPQHPNSTILPIFELTLVFIKNNVYNILYTIHGWM